MSKADPVPPRPDFHPPADPAGPGGWSAGPLQPWARRRRPPPPVPDSWRWPQVLPVLVMPFGFTFLLFGAFFFAFELHGVGVFLVFSFLQEAVLAASVLWWVRRVDHAPMSTLGWAGFAWGDIGFGLAMGVAVIVGSSVANLIVQEIVRAILGHVPTSSTVASELHGWATIPLTVLIAAAAPVCEELFFRGFLYQALKQRFRLGTATIVSAAAFAFVHFQPLNFVGLTVGGVILAVTFEQRRSLVSSMVAHATLNALVIGITLASR